MRNNCLVMGIALDKIVAQERIRQRAENMLQEGIIEEVRRLATQYRWENPAFRTVGYSAFSAMAQGLISALRRQLTNVSVRL